MKKLWIFMACAGLFSAAAQAEPAPLEFEAVADAVLEDADRVRLREAAFILEGEPDPRLHLHAVIVLAEEKTLEVEEAFVTLMPFDAALRLGKFRPKIGQVLREHRHDLDTADEPLAVQHYFGEEGMSKAGAEFTHPFFGLEGTLAVIRGGNGEGGTAFGENESRPTIYGRLEKVLKSCEASELTLGSSGAMGSRDPDPRFEVGVLAFDAVFTHRFDAERVLKLQGEAFNIDRSESFLEVEDPDTGDITEQDIDGNVWGAYVLADLRLHAQGSAGFRWDYVEPVENPLENPEKADIGYTGYLTFRQTDSLTWRVQLSRTELADGGREDRVFLQCLFAFGGHGHEGH